MHPCLSLSLSLLLLSLLTLALVFQRVSLFLSFFSLHPSLISLFLALFLSCSLSPFSLFLYASFSASLGAPFSVPLQIFRSHMSFCHLSLCLPLFFFCNPSLTLPCYLLEFIYMLRSGLRIGSFEDTVNANYAHHLCSIFFDPGDSVVCSPP